MNNEKATAKGIHIAKSLKSQLNEPKLVNKYVFANALTDRLEEGSTGYNTQYKKLDGKW